MPKNEGAKTKAGLNGRIIIGPISFGRLLELRWRLPTEAEQHEAIKE
jgi:hypothetical protein